MTADADYNPTPAISNGPVHSTGGLRIPVEG